MPPDTPLSSADKSTPAPLAPEDLVRLESDPFGRLVLSDRFGRSWAGVEPIRTFPLSAPDHYISLRGPDRAELLLVDSLDRLQQPVRDALQRELALREFRPRVERIIAADRSTFPCHWQVQTDRGPTTIHLHNEDAFRRLDASRILLTDAFGGQFLLPDPLLLDPHSRHILRAFV